MKVELTDAQWLHEHAEVSVEELAELSGLSPELLRELVEYGALVPININAQVPNNAEVPINAQVPANAQVPTNAEPAQWSFTAEYIVPVRTVGRLREDFDLEPNALALALKLIERIHGLEAQLRDLQTQFPRLRVKR